MLDSHFSCSGFNSDYNGSQNYPITNIKFNTLLVIYSVSFYRYETAELCLHHSLVIAQLVGNDQWNSFTSNITDVVLKWQETSLSFLTTSSFLVPCYELSLSSLLKKLKPLKILNLCPRVVTTPTEVTIGVTSETGTLCCVLFHDATTFHTHTLLPSLYSANPLLFFQVKTCTTESFQSSHLGLLLRRMVFLMTPNHQVRRKKKQLQTST